MGLNGFILKTNKNPTNFQPNWAGLAVLFSRQLPNGSQDFFHFNISIFIYFFKYETIETLARVFLPLNISALGSVVGGLAKIKKIIFFASPVCFLLRVLMWQQAYLF